MLGNNKCGKNIHEQKDHHMYIYKLTYFYVFFKEWKGYIANLILGLCGKVVKKALRQFEFSSLQNYPWIDVGDLV